VMVTCITCHACRVSVRVEVVDASETRVRNGDFSACWAPDSAEPRRLDKIRLPWVEIGRYDVLKVPRRIGRCRRWQEVQQSNVELDIESLSLCRLCNRKDQQHGTANEKNSYSPFHLSSPFACRLADCQQKSTG